jgi:hypothetical protein
LPNIYRIHPAIGIARVGDSESPDGYFVGPEAPGVPPSLNPPDAPHDPNAGYKDDQGRIKRQGARFRIYEYTLDDAGTTTKVREITADEAQIEWEVHLANRKAAAPEFSADEESGDRRNNGVPEEELIIDAGSQKISGVGQDMKQLRGSFMDTIVQLGDLLTDSAGRLIVLGGIGKSQSPLGRKPRHYANNDGWCDDTSDGPVRATVRVNGSTETIETDPAWVIVAPPDFAPPIESVVTLYDVVYNMMVKFDPSLATSDATKVSFTHDIYPIFRRVSNMHWVSMVAAIGHGPEQSLGHFSSLAQRLSDKSPRVRDLRRFIFRRLRNPQGGGGSMPKLPVNPDPDNPAVLSLTEAQYERMRRWAEGEFEDDWPEGGEPTPLPLDELPDMETPHALDRAALEACVGGGFFPGIEVGRIMLEESTYDKNRPFRVNAQFSPGVLTARMAVPWQADFLACSFVGDDDEPFDRRDWWPSQRPNDVYRGQVQGPWIPPNWTEISNMVDNWSQLGFVVKEEDTDRYVEDERDVEGEHTPNLQ